MEKVVLYGAGGHARVVIDCVQDSGREVEGIFDDDEGLVSLNGFDVIGSYDPQEFSECELIVSIGDNMTRKKVVNKVSHSFTSALHPSSVISKYTRLGEGSVFMQGSIVQAGTTIGKHCILNTGCTVDHDSVIGDFVHVSPGVTICASVSVGEGTHIGAGATVLPGVKIGDWCQIGAGAVITKEVPDQCVVIGVPGKIVRSVDLV